MAANEEVLEICERCGAMGAPGILLWDDRRYCSRCLGERSKRLAEYARQHEILTETVPFTTWEVIRKYVLSWPLIVVGLFGPVLLCTAIIQKAWKESFIGAAVLGSIGALVGFLFGFATAHALKKQRPTFAVRGKYLFITDPSCEEPMAFPLDACEWYRGRVSHMSLQVMLPDAPAINIVLPDDADEDETVIAVGYSEEMRELWEAFLSIAGVPQREPWVKLSRFRRWCDVVAAILLFPLCVIGSAMLWNLVRSAGQRVLPGNDIVEATAFFFVLPGTFVPTILAYRYWPWSSWRLIPVERSAEERRSRKWRSILGMGIVTISLILSAFRYPDWSMAAKTVYAALCICWGLGIGCYAAYVSMNYDGVTSRPK